MEPTASRDLLNNTKNFAISTKPQVFNNTLDISEHDLYKFTLLSHSSLNLSVENLTADANVRLIRDSNQNGIVDRGEVVKNSLLSGSSTESINTYLRSGTYYIQVYHKDSFKTDYELTVFATPFDNAGNTLDTARDISLSVSNHYSDWVGTSDNNDYYKFYLDTTSTFNLGLSNLSVDADVQLLDINGSTIASSANTEIFDESITRTLDSGTYYVRIYPYEGDETYYTLNLSAIPISDSVTEAIPTSGDSVINYNSSNIPSSDSSNQSPTPVDSPPYFQGTLRADTFTYSSSSNLTIFSGNGNVEFGSKKDILDLNNIYFNTISWNPANTTGGGVVYNPGNGNRVFDEIRFTDGKQILFEGIDTIKFADTTIDLSITPNDPQFYQQWNLHMMGVHNAWRFTTGSDKVLVGIQDTGLANNSAGQFHPDLRATNFFGDNYLEEPTTAPGHGTSVEGVIAATSNNGTGISGINWKSGIIFADVVGQNAGDLTLAEATQKMIDLADTQGQRLIINLSLTGGYSPDWEQVIKTNRNKALFVIASGNTDTNTLTSPADLAINYDNVMAVGASWGLKDWYNTDRTPGTRISYPGWWASTYGPGLTLTAPSEFVTTSATLNSSGGFDFGYNNLFNGTSAATPNVTGVASLVWSVNPKLSATDIKKILQDTAYDLGTSGYDIEYGSGFVNADAAVRTAMALGRGAA